MLIRQKEPGLSTTSSHHDLTDTLHGLLEAVRQSAAPGQIATLARTALREAENAVNLMEKQTRRIASLESDSLTDPLTGVLNRRGFEHELQTALSEGHRYGQHGAVLFLDMDDFKQINDTLGHAAGDAVLCKVAGILKANVRDSDRVARLGGDEFAVLMSRTSIENAKARTDSIEWMINSSALDWNGQPIAIRVSFGSDYFGPGKHCAEDGNAIMVRADQDMYRQKLERRKVPRSEFPIENQMVRIPSMISTNG